MASDVRRGAESALRGSMRILQSRLESSAAKLPSAAEALHEGLRRILQKAIRAEAIKTPAYNASELLTCSISSKKSRQGGRVYAIAGGPKDFERLVTDIDPKMRIVRDDGGIIHFTITVEEVPGADSLYLHAYDFELYFPPTGPTGFVRFDLNEPGHDNDDLGIRSHLHPSNDNLLVPSPVLSPTELLSFLIYGMRLRREAGRT